MKKGLLLGLAIAGVAAAAAVIYKNAKDKRCYCDEFDDDFDDIDCDCCCDDCCAGEIPADKAEDAGVIDACVCCEEEELDKIDEPVESDEV